WLTGMLLSTLEVTGNEYEVHDPSRFACTCVSRLLGLSRTLSDEGAHVRRLLDELASLRSTKPARKRRSIRTRHKEREEFKRLVGVFGIGEGHLLHRKTRRVSS